MVLLHQIYYFVVTIWLISFSLKQVVKIKLLHDFSLSSTIPAFVTHIFLPRCSPRDACHLHRPPDQSPRATKPAVLHCVNQVLAKQQDRSVTRQLTELPNSAPLWPKSVSIFVEHSREYCASCVPSLAFTIFPHTQTYLGFQDGTLLYITDSSVHMGSSVQT